MVHSVAKIEMMGKLLGPKNRQQMDVNIAGMEAKAHSDTAEKI